MSKFYELKAVNNKGQEVSMADFKGKPVLITNTASACGFTPQFEGQSSLGMRSGIVFAACSNC